MCGGWTPSVHLYSQSRGRLRFDERLAAFLPGDGPRRAFGRRVPRYIRLWPHASRRASRRRQPLGAAVRPARDHAMSTLRAASDRSIGKAFVDFQNDVTAKDLRRAAQ